MYHRLRSHLACENQLYGSQGSVIAHHSLSLQRQLIFIAAPQRHHSGPLSNQDASSSSIFSSSIPIYSWVLQANGETAFRRSSVVHGYACRLLNNMSTSSQGLLCRNRVLLSQLSSISLTRSRTIQLEQRFPIILPLCFRVLLQSFSGRLIRVLPMALLGIRRSKHFSTYILQLGYCQMLYPSAYLTANDHGLRAIYLQQTMGAPTAQPEQQAQPDGS